MNTACRVFCRTFQTIFRAAIPLLPYREPVILGNESECASLLQKKDKKSVLIVTDEGVYGAGIVTDLENALKDAGISCTVYKDTVPNPTVANVEAARQKYLDNHCDAIIGFGGGSAIDCAKAAGARIVNPRRSVNSMKGVLRIFKRLPLFIAVPTTAGTGSETTLAAVITDDKTRHKYPINAFCLIPHYAMLNPHITEGLPKQLTATTGMDALTHAVEAYIGNSTTRHTRTMAVEAVTLIHRYLLASYADGSDLKARAGMQRAAYCAGCAFTISYVGYVHGVAHSLGGRYDIPHGLANAVLLPYFLEEYGAVIDKKLAVLARRSGVVSHEVNDHAAAMEFINWIKLLNVAMGIPEKLSGIRKEDIPMLARHAARESNPLYPVPVLMSAKELEKMYYRIMPDDPRVSGCAETS